MTRDDRPGLLAVDAVKAFESEGCLGPFRLLSEAECRLVIRHWQSIGHLADPDWPKDIATKDLFFRDLGRYVAARLQLQTLLGPRMVLWAASVVDRKPGQTHSFHTDIESSNPAGGFASVWIGLENTSRGSSLQLLTRSHHHGSTVQQATHERGLARGQASPQQMLEWIRAAEPSAELLQHDMDNGDALIFDGRLWHGSHNSSDRHRSALLLQFAKEGVAVPIQERGSVGWPFRLTGRNAAVVNVSPAAASDSLQRNEGDLPDFTFAVGRDSVRHADERGWKPFPVFRGRTPNATAMGVHVSVLSPGYSPHPPHCHIEEEVLVILEGEANIVVPRSKDDPHPRIETLRAGDFVYYPAYQYHTIRNGSRTPVKYQMFRWQGPTGGRMRLGTHIFRSVLTAKRTPSPATRMDVIFEAPTEFLSKFHAHVTVMPPGAGYPVHDDRHDVAIIVFSGAPEASGRTFGPLDSIYYAGGAPHGMRNTAETPATYLVFEFHA